MFFLLRIIPSIRPHYLAVSCHTCIIKRHWYVAHEYQTSCTDTSNTYAHTNNNKYMTARTPHTNMERVCVFDASETVYTKRYNPAITRATVRSCVQVITERP